MSSRGQSLSLFVVQRTFKTVRRGYDPEEVDRHLEQVSRWFVSTTVGEALSHERAALQERERVLERREADAAHILEGARLEADATLEGARRRADADAAAGREADRIAEAARRERRSGG
jgi:DivIVA domain-containing protein